LSYNKEQALTHALKGRVEKRRQISNWYISVSLERVESNLKGT